jgi:hypothetical protein
MRASTALAPLLSESDRDVWFSFFRRPSGSYLLQAPIEMSSVVTGTVGEASLAFSAVSNPSTRLVPGQVVGGLCPQ